MKEINKYIDICLIKEYGLPNPSINAYELDIDDLPDHEINSFLDELMSDDTNVRDIVRYHMQKLIQERLCEVSLR